MEDLTSLVEYVAKSLVSDPDAVRVEAQQRGRTVAITLVVPPEEMGKVIGRQGRVARSLRTMLAIGATQHRLRASLDIHD